MSEAGTLLEHAELILAGGTAHSNRMACWIARAALESTVDDLLDAKDRAAPEASMRSKLTVLQVAFDSEPTVSLQADYAWTALSRVCHYHAFEFTSSAAEARHLLELVSALADA